MRDSWMRTAGVALLLCIVCSVLVSLSAVGLRKRQNRNKELERKKNILIAAGLYDEQRQRIIAGGDLTIPELFTESKDRQWVETQIIDLETGEQISKATEQQIVERFGSLERYDQFKAANDASGAWSEEIAGDKDIAKVKRRERYSFVYLVHNSDGVLEQIILPIRGYGLWSTLRGFIALKADLTRIRGITYYQHGETPGLGGEVDNPDWKAKWKDKVAIADGKVVVHVIKGAVDSSTANAEQKIDGLSGATITSKGVTNMLHYWLGDDGFGPYLKELRRK